ncbi:unnamed protein product [Vitrella brassicaformis CCMP3155]|uniref:AAA+ ATPase domain-containing protein n=2 Tax=Vitrella brassicaformis TaxID=1169539 RepID=A0A0G4FBM1_VITBC|nr:unnamed protein product [Vitrella brassicaformis CCMP3155]|eukprot:CEM10008.1 unnamed protein product [Vitrella brassicaformis CCMP3155]
MSLARKTPSMERSSSSCRATTPDPPCTSMLRRDAPVSQRTSSCLQMLSDLLGGEALYSPSTDPSHQRMIPSAPQSPPSPSSPHSPTLSRSASVPHDDATDANANGGEADESRPFSLSRWLSFRRFSSPRSDDHHQHQHHPHHDSCRERSVSSHLPVVDEQREYASEVMTTPYCPSDHHGERDGYEAGRAAVRFRTASEESSWSGLTVVGNLSTSYVPSEPDVDRTLSEDDTGWHPSSFSPMPPPPSVATPTPQHTAEPSEIDQLLHFAGCGGTRRSSSSPSPCHPDEASSGSSSRNAPFLGGLFDSFLSDGTHGSFETEVYRPSVDAGDEHDHDEWEEEDDASENEAADDAMSVKFLFASPLTMCGPDGQLCPLPPLDWYEELRTLEHAFQTAGRSDVAIEASVATTAALRSLLTLGGGQLLHLSAHGLEGGLAFEDGRGSAHVATPAFFRTLLEAVYSGASSVDDTDNAEGCSSDVQLVFLNCCHSYEIGVAIASAGIPHVICVSNTVQDQAARQFTAGFYLALASGKDVGVAYMLGRAAVQSAPHNYNTDAESFVLLPHDGNHSQVLCPSASSSNSKPRPRDDPRPPSLSPPSPSGQSQHSTHNNNTWLCERSKPPRMTSGESPGGPGPVCSSVPCSPGGSGGLSLSLPPSLMALPSGHPSIVLPHLASSPLLQRWQQSRCPVIRQLPIVFGWIGFGSTPDDQAHSIPATTLPTPAPTPTSAQQPSLMSRLFGIQRSVSTEPAPSVTGTERRKPARRVSCFVKRHLPQPPEDFVGRTLDVWVVLQLLDRRRLVLLHGEEGVGKTAVCEEVSRYCALRGEEIFPGGVIFLRLAPLSNLPLSVEGSSCGYRVVKETTNIIHNLLATVLEVPQFPPGHRRIKHASSARDRAASEHTVEGGSFVSDEGESNVDLEGWRWRETVRVLTERLRKGRCLLVLDGVDDFLKAGGLQAVLTQLLLGDVHSVLNHDLHPHMTEGLEGLHIVVSARTCSLSTRPNYPPLPHHKASTLPNNTDGPSDDTSRKPIQLISEGKVKVVSQELMPLDRAASADLFLRRVGRPLCVRDVSGRGGSSGSGGGEGGVLGRDEAMDRLMQHPIMERLKGNPRSIIEMAQLVTPQLANLAALISYQE